MKKVWISLLLVMAMLIASLTITALAEEDTTSAAFRNGISQDLKNQTYLAELSDGCTAVCPFCNAPVTWKDVATGGNVETAGHYFLSQNCNAFFSFSGATCLYLNGYDLTAAGSVVAYLPTGSTLTVMGKGTETVTGKGYNSTSSRYGAAFDLNGGSLNLCGGIYTKNNTNPGPVLAARTGAVGGEVINIYSGTTVRGGRNDTMGGNIALYATGAELNIYGGTISGGNATSGGNIAANGSSATVCNEINIYGGTITGGVAADRGGNIISYYGNVNISGGEVSNGEAYIGGNIAMMRSGADLMISGSANISGGKAQHGGNIRTQEGATMAMTGGTVSGGTATGATNSQGGNINANEGSVTVSGGTISGGTSADCGANIFLNPGTSMQVSGTANITGGTANATGGGTIAMNGATLTMTGGSITGGTGKLGAALFMYGNASATVSGGTITGGTATDGGAVRIQENGGTFTLSGGTVTGGTANGQGGNFSIKPGSTLNIVSGTVSGGTSKYQGGNIYSEGTVNITGGTVTGGKTTDSVGGNIAILERAFSAANATISNGNAHYGGNLYVASGANAFALTNCTLSSNSDSGTIRNIYHEAPATLTGCTLNDVSGGNNIQSKANLTLVNTAVNNTYMIQSAGTLTLSGNTTVYGVLPSKDVTKLHVAADFTGTASFDQMPVPEGVYGCFMDETRYTSGGNFTGAVKLADKPNKPQLHGKDGKLVGSAARLRNQNVSTEYNWYRDAEAAIYAYDALQDKTGYYVHLMCNADVVVPAGKTAYINFNGETPAEVTVGEGAKLYAFDSSAPVGKQSNTIYNTTKLETIFRAPNGIIYAAVPGATEGTMVTAAVEIKITGVSLRTHCAGIYYTATVNTHSSVASKLTAGIALNLDTVPGENFKTTSLYTAQTGFQLDSHGADLNGVLVNNILKSDAATAERADRDICAVAYIEYAGETFLSESKIYSLTDLMGLLDAKVDSLNPAQKNTIQNFYNLYAARVGWSFEGITSGTRQPGDEGKTLKVLTLGHSLALDSNHMLTRIAAAEGYTDLKIGTLYYSGCYLSQHVQHLQNDSAVYNLYISSTQTPDTPPAITEKVTMQYALQLDYWDIVVMQGGVFEIADDSAYKNGNIQTIQNYVKSKCPNPNVEFAWHMTWAPPVTESLQDQYTGSDDYYRKSYEPYNNDRTLLYNTIVTRVKNNILYDKSFRFIIPTGTVMENALSSYLAETDLHRDYVHASDFARVMNAYLWYCKLTGVNQLTELKMDTIPVAFFNSTQGTENRVLTDDEKAIILEAVNNTLKTPFATTQSQYAALEVGYSKVNITPSYEVVLGGYGDYENRIYDTVLDQLYITCIAVTEGNQTVLIFTCDNLLWNTALSREVRPLITAATGVPDGNIFFSATHAHGAPMATVSNTGSAQYRADLRVWAVEAAKNALADRAEATVFTGSKQVQGMNFVRHYLCSDGSYMGSNFNINKEDLVVAHVDEPDDQMTLIKFDRVEGKKDVLMVNWQAHADHTSENGYKMLTADYPGVMRATLESQTGMEVAYFTGASGNLNAHSKLPEKEHGLGMVAYGEALAQEAMSILGNMTQMDEKGIKVSRVNSTVYIDHSWDDSVSEAERVVNLRDTLGRDLATEVGKYYGFSSTYQADMIIARSKMSATDTMELNAFCIGDIGFVNGSYEMFSQNGLYIKANSPFATTFIMEGNYTYLATEEAYDYRSYEADTGYYVKGTAEDMADAFVSMLNALK